MELSNYLPTSNDLLTMARAHDLRDAKPILAALERRIAEVRNLIEARPIRSDDLRQDCGGLLCELRGLRWIFNLIDEAQHRVATIEESENGR